MGGLLSFFRRKKPEPTDYAQILEKISADVEELKKEKTGFISSHRRAIAQLLIGFCLIELLLVVWYYFHQKPPDLFDHALHIAPLFLVPILVFQLKKLISFYYNKRIERCDEKIQELIEQQKEKVAELKRITNFDVVSTLLNRYDPEARRRPPQGTPQPKPKPKPRPQPTPQQPTPSHPQPPVPATPVVRTPAPAPTLVTPKPVPTPSIRVPPTPQQTPTYVMPVPKLHNPTPLPPAPVAGQRRGLLDRVVDFLVGDGPEYSVAVTCKYCNVYYANLPKEEVPYARFSCHNCGRLNEEENSSKQGTTATVSSGEGGARTGNPEREKEKETSEGDSHDMEPEKNKEGGTSDDSYEDTASDKSLDQEAYERTDGGAASYEGEADRGAKAAAEGESEGLPESSDAEEGEKED